MHYWASLLRVRPEETLRWKSSATRLELTVMTCESSRLDTSHAQLAISTLTLSTLAQLDNNKIMKLVAAGNLTRDNLAWAASALPLSYYNWTTTSPHNPLYNMVQDVITIIEYCLEAESIYMYMLFKSTAKLLQKVFCNCVSCGSNPGGQFHIATTPITLVCKCLPSWCIVRPAHPT